MKGAPRRRKPAHPAILESLEHRILLDGGGPQVISPVAGQVLGDLTVTFDRPIDPATFGVNDVAIPLASPSRLGGYDTSGTAYGVAAAGAMVYVADGANGLVCIDVSNPAAPARLGDYDTSGTSYGVAVVGTMAYVADGYYGLVCIDVSNPAAPSRVGGYDTSGTSYGVAVVGTMAYVADGSYGLVCIDVSNPASPVRKGSYDTPGTARGVTVAGTTAYVADYDQGLQIIDVSNPAVPALLGACHTNRYAYGVAVTGKLALLADGFLRLIDVSNPAAPAMLSTYSNNPGFAGGVAVCGNLAYITSDTGGLLVLDLTTPSAPVLLGTYDTPGLSNAVAASGTMAYVADTASGLQDIQVLAQVDSVTPISDTEFRAVLGPSFTDGPYRIFIGPSISDVTGRLMDQDQDGVGGEPVQDAYAVRVTLDLTPPAAPVGLTFSPHTGAIGGGFTSASQVTFSWTAPTDVAGIAGYQYRLDGGSWLAASQTSVAPALQEGPHTFDVRTVDSLGRAGATASLALTTDQTAPSQPTNLRLGGNVLSWDAATDSNGIWKHQWRMNNGNWQDTLTTSATTPFQQGQTASFEVRGIDPAGNIGPTASMVANPVPGPHVIAPADNQAMSELAITFDRPIDSATFTAEDVAIPLASPTRLGVYDTPGTSFGVAVSGAKAYVADGYSGLQILNISNPASPTRLGYFNYNNIVDAVGVAVVGTTVYLADANHCLRIVDVSNPASPNQRGSYSTYDTIQGVAVVGNLAYLAYGTTGLVILDVSDPANPVQRGVCDTPGRAYGVAVVGTHAYVADYDKGLQVIDVSNPASPTLVGTYDTAGAAYGLAVCGTLAFIADGSDGLRIVDVSDPAAPAPRGSYDTPGTAEGVAICGDLAYVADYGSGLQVVDVSNPAAPVRLSTYDTSGSAYGLAVSGGIAYVADGDSGLQDIQTLNQVTGIGSSNSTTFRLTLAQSLPEGPCRMFIGPNLATAAGLPMDQDQDGVAGEVPQDICTVTVLMDYTPPLAPSGLAFSPKTGAAAGNATSASQLTFSWSVQSDQAGIARHEYRLDGGAWVPTALTTVSLTLAEADHTFQVRAVDVLGRAGPAATLAVSVDQTPPAAPSALRLDGRVLSWNTATDAHGIWKYQWQVDGVGWQDSSTCTALTSMADGRTAFVEVRALDPAGNTGPIASATLTAVYGPRIVSPPARQAVGLADGLTVTFDRPVAPSTFTTADVTVALPTPTALGSYGGVGAYGVALAGTMAYLAAGSAGLVDLDVSNPASPVVRGTYGTSGTSYGVAVAGTMAYVADGSYGLVCIDVSNPAAPVRKGGYDTTGISYGVAVVGTTAYVADGSYGLVCIDVSNPASPVRLGGYDTSGSAYGVTVVGNLAYVADYAAGLQIIDVSNPAAPVRVGGYDTAGYAYAVTVSGTLAYVADYTKGLQIIDVSNPASPVLLGGYDTSGQAQGVSVLGGLAIVADGSAGLQVIDVSNPAAPLRLGGCSTGGSAYGITVSGSTAYVANSSAGLQTFRVLSAASSVTPVSDTTFRVGLPDGAYGVFIGPGVANTFGTFMDQNADGVGGDPTRDVYSVTIAKDSTVPMPPANLAMSPDTGQADGHVTTAGDLTFSWAGQTDVAGIVLYAYSLDGGDWASTTQRTVGPTLPEGAHVFQVKAVDALGRTGQPASLAVTVDQTSPGVPGGPWLDGRTLRWNPADDANGIWKYQWRLKGGDWQDASACQALTGLADGQNAPFDVRAFDRAGNVGLATSADLTAVYGPRIVQPGPGQVVGPAGTLNVVFDRPVDPATFTSADVAIALPSPTLLAQYKTSAWGSTDVVVAGTLAYVSDYTGGLQIIDVSNPAGPVRLGQCQVGGYAYGLAIAGTLVYVADGSGGLQIVDVSDPSAPVRVGNFTTSNWAQAVTVVGSLAYVAANVGGLQIIDVSNPAAPVYLGGCAAPGLACDVVVVGTTAYMADSGSGLQIIDVSNPAAPVRRGGYDTPGYAYGVAVAGTRAFVADGDSGIQVIDVSNPAAPVRLGGYDTVGMATDVALMGHLAVVADFTNGLEVLDVSNPAAPVRLGGYDKQGDAWAVDVAGPVAYVVNGANWLQTLLVTAQTGPVSAVNPTTFSVSLPQSIPLGDCRLFIGPDVAGASGSAMDQDGDGIGGEPADDMYAVTVTKQPASVVGRYVFYNASYWDGNDSAASALDDAAIAPDKQALLPGQTAAFANYTSYFRGINGVVIDVSSLPPGTPTAADFEFRAGNGGDPASWPLTAAPASITVRRGAGAGGSDRVTLIWSDASAVRNQWLRVTVRAGGGMGLAAADVFCFGNAMGDVGNSATDARVDTLDVSLTRENQTTYVNPPEITNPYDFNRDHRVDTLDVSLARSSQTTYAIMANLISLPVEGGLPPVVVLPPAGGGLGAVPSDLVTPLGGDIVAPLADTGTNQESAAYVTVPTATATGAAAAAVAPLASTIVPATSAAATRLSAAVLAAPVPAVRTADALAVCAASSMPWAPLAGPVARWTVDPGVRMLAVLEPRLPSPLGSWDLHGLPGLPRRAR